jgi:hypothetical protein
MANTAVRWSGLLLILGAVLFGAAIVISSLDLDKNSPGSFLLDIFLFFSSILMLLSFPAMYAKQVGLAGWLGLVGFILLQVGILLLTVASSPSLRFPSYHPTGSDNALDFFLGVALTLGLLLTGLATFRARVFPRWAAILMLGATAGFFLAFFVDNIASPIVHQIMGASLVILLVFSFSRIGFVMLKEGLTPDTKGAAQVLSSPAMESERQV